MSEEQAIRLQLDAIDEQFRRRVERRPDMTAAEASSLPRTPEEFERLKRDWMASREPYVAKLSRLKAHEAPPPILIPIAEAERLGLLESKP